MSPQELRALIESDAEAKTLFQNGIDNACAERCSAIAPLVTIPVSVAEVRRAAAISGALAKIKIAARETSTASVEVQEACLTFLDLMDHAETIDFSHPVMQGKAAALIAANIVTQQQFSDLSALSHKPQTFTHSDIANLRE